VSDEKGGFAKLLIIWWALVDSNYRPLPCQGRNGQSHTDMTIENIQDVGLDGVPSVCQMAQFCVNCVLGEK
jgi:hypothetical protein